MNIINPFKYKLYLEGDDELFALVGFDFDVSYADVVSGIKSARVDGDINDYENNMNRIKMMLENNSMGICKYFIFKNAPDEFMHFIEYVYIIIDSRNERKPLVARLTYDLENNFMYSDVHDFVYFFYDYSMFYVEYCFSLHNHKIPMSKFFNYYSRLCGCGDYKGEFYEFLECDEILDYINYFKMIEY